MLVGNLQTNLCLWNLPLYGSYVLVLYGNMLNGWLVWACFRESTAHTAVLFQLTKMHFGKAGFILVIILCDIGISSLPLIKS